jgi:serine/threonine-protein kinase HipA
MAAYEPVPAIEVYAWGHWVGRIALDEATGFYAFGYTPEWIARGVELAPFHMPVRSDPYEFPQLSQETFYRLPAVFADALPDKFGNALVDAWMSENGVSRDEVTPLDRLAYAANRAMGALTFEPPTGPPVDGPAIIQLADLVLAARKTVHGDASTDDGLNDALKQLIQVGTSAGGARAKAVILFNKETSQLRSGHADHEDGFADYLLKLDGVANFGMDGRVDDLGRSAPYGRIEYAYYRMATDAGIAMEHSELLPEGPRTHFLTRRFDRGPNGERHHLISLCALDHLDFNLNGAHSYDQYLDAVRRLGLGPDDMAQAFRRMVFNVVAVNRDDHTKNLAFLLREGGSWELAPAFDVTHSHNVRGGWTQKHQMRVNGKVENITREDLHAVGDRQDVPAYKSVVNEVVETVKAWNRHAEEAGVPERETNRIRADIDTYWPAGA